MQELVLRLPPLIEQLREAQQALVNHFAATGLKFTLDGRLVGDIGEAIALEYFAIERPKIRTKGVDAVVSATGQTVQVKTTGQASAGPAFSRGTAVAELLLFLRLDMLSGTAIVLYNGPEAPIRESLTSSPDAGTVSVRLSAVLEARKQLRKGQPCLQVPLRVGAQKRLQV
jgi:hypothetical protein